MHNGLKHRDFWRVGQLQGWKKFPFCLSQKFGRCGSIRKLTPLRIQTLRRWLRDRRLTICKKMGMISWGPHINTLHWTLQMFPIVVRIVTHLLFRNFDGIPNWCNKQTFDALTLSNSGISRWVFWITSVRLNLINHLVGFIPCQICL